MLPDLLQVDHTAPEHYGDWAYWPELLAVPVPRYTSYPTAAEFTDEPFEAHQRTALADVRGDVSLYLHIPFCQEICWYCGCNTGAANKTQRLAAYLERCIGRPAFKRALDAQLGDFRAAA